MSRKQPNPKPIVPNKPTPPPPPKVQKPAKKGTVPTKVIKDAVKKVVSERKTIAKRTRKPKANSSVNNVVESSTGNTLVCESGNISAVINMTKEENLQNENYNLSGKVSDLTRELYTLSWELRSSNNLFHEANNELFRLKNKSLWQRIKDVFCYE